MNASHLTFFIKPKNQGKLENTFSREHHLAEGVPQGNFQSCTCFVPAVDGYLLNLSHGVKAALNMDSLVIY